MLGFATGLVNVWLLVRQHILNWPLGILNVLLLMLVFWSAGLYADAGLQIVYVVLGCYGWWAWIYGGARPHPARRPRDHPRRVARRSAVAGVLLTGGLWLFLDRLTGSTVPLADAVTTALSLLATYGQTPQAAGELVALDRRRPDLHPAVRVQGPLADRDPVRGLPRALRARPARLAGRAACEPVPVAA